MAALIVFGGAASATRARAQTVAEAETLLQSGDKEQIEAGIQTLGLVGTKEAVAPLVARIRDGLPPEQLETAIVTLMALGDESAGPLLFDLLSHRRPLIRLRAVEALAVLKPEGAEAGLVSALSDSDEKVRDAAAQALGEIGARGSVEVLFHALDRGNLHASSAIGKLMRAEQLSRLADYLGKLPLRSLGPAITEVLRRKDVPDSVKLDFVARLQELATAGIRDFLQDVLATAGDDLSPKVKRAILSAMRGISS